jgi:transcriptional regulator with XRE-family HTH domain
MENPARAVALLLQYQRNWTQVELARKFRCSQATVCGLLAGRRTPGLALALRIESVTKIAPCEWLR